MSKLKKLLSAAVGGILAVNLISMLPVGAEENTCSEGVILNSTLGINLSLIHILLIIKSSLSGTCDDRKLCFSRTDF